MKSCRIQLILQQMYVMTNIRNVCLTAFAQDEQWPEPGNLSSENESESGDDIVEWDHRDSEDITPSQ